MKTYIECEVMITSPQGTLLMLIADTTYHYVHMSRRDTKPLQGLMDRGYVERRQIYPDASGFKLTGLGEKALDLVKASNKAKYEALLSVSRIGERNA